MRFPFQIKHHSDNGLGIWVLEDSDSSVSLSARHDGELTWFACFGSVSSFVLYFVIFVQPHVCDHQFLRCISCVLFLHSQKGLPHRSLPLSHRSLLLSHHSLPLNHHSLPLNHHSLPLNHHSLPLSHHNLPLSHHSLPLTKVSGHQHSLTATTHLHIIAP